MQNTLKYMVLLLTFFWGTDTTAQNVGDALRYIDLSPSGTARFMATGGALGPLGADLSVVNTNPAGIGFFRSSEFTITPALFLNSTSSRLRNADRFGAQADDKVTFNLHNLGMVIASRPLSKKWKNVNFGITLNHLADFNRAYTFGGNSVGSIAESWQEQANGTIGINGFETALALNAGVLYDFNEDGVYDIDYELNRDAVLFRNQSVIEEGSMSELAFTFAGNYDEKLAIGLTIGVPIINYAYQKTYAEVDDNAGAGGAVPYFESLEFTENLRTTGSGINAKFGFIFRANQAFRFGGSVHTPSILSLEDNFDNRLVNNYYEDELEQGQFLGTDEIAEGFFDYQLNTPWRYTGGVGFLFGKNGFLSADVEYADFPSTRFSYDGFDADQRAVNQEITNELQDQLIVRIGGEVAIDNFRFRLGYNLRSAPFINDESNRNQYSAGVGYRYKGFFVDLGYRYTTFETLYYPYVTEEFPIQEVRNNFSVGQIGLTIGSKF